MQRFNLQVSSRVMVFPGRLEILSIFACLICYSSDLDAILHHVFYAERITYNI